MENIKIILDGSNQIDVNGIFYVYNSKYYFIYTLNEIDENEYVKLYIVQVCKEVKNTPTGPIDTGYMIGLQIEDPEEWKKVQESITKIVEDKKNGTKNIEIQYLPMNMLVNLKVISNNKFKLMKHIIVDNFKVNISTINDENKEHSNIVSNPTPVSIQLDQFNQENETSVSVSDNVIDGDVIIDYRSRFFEEQQKNKVLEEEIRILNEKLNNIKNIIE